MSVSLQMLGTGNAFAKNYFNNNALLMDKDYTLLVDCGLTALQAMDQLGRSFKDVNATLITHIHADHVGGLGELAFTLKHNYRKKMILLVPEPLVGPLKDVVISLEDLFEVRPMRPGLPFKLSPNITLELIRTPHISGKDSYSLLINNNIFYSADMIFQPDLLLSLVRERGVRMILHDCQLLGQGHVHTTLEELMSLPAEVRSIIKLMHYSDEKPDFMGHIGEMEFLEQQLIYKLSTDDVDK